jgi:hypothetical protein
MIARLSVLFLLALASATGLAGQIGENSRIVGVWRGAEGSLPVITLTISDESGKLAGAALFYLIRGAPGRERSSSPGIPEPLIDPSFDWKTLTFKVSHRHAHKGTEHDPPVILRMELAGPNRARAFGPEGASVEMMRENIY